MQQRIKEIHSMTRHNQKRKDSVSSSNNTFLDVVLFQSMSDEQAEAVNGGTLTWPWPHQSSKIGRGGKPPFHVEIVK